MARLNNLPEPLRSHIDKLPLPAIDSRSWVTGPPLNTRRVSLVSTAGLHLRGDRPFTLEPEDAYRVIPGDVGANELVMSHVSTNFDRSAYQQDINVVFPLERLRELALQKVVGSVAGLHYSFMGALEPQTMKDSARKLARLLIEDGVDAVLLVPV